MKKIFGSLLLCFFTALSSGCNSHIPITTTLLNFTKSQVVTPNISKKERDLTFTNFYGEYSVPMGWSRERITGDNWRGNLFVDPKDSNQYLKVTNHWSSNSNPKKFKSNPLTILDTRNVIHSTLQNNGQDLIYQMVNNNSNYVTYGKIQESDGGYKEVKFTLPTVEKDIAERVVRNFWASK